MNSNSPSQPDGELGVSAQQLFFNLLFLFVEGVTHVLPDISLHIVFQASFGNDADDTFFLSHSRTFEDPQREEKKAAAKKVRTAKKEDAPKIENVAASTTLGDIDALAQLKAQMEKGEKK